LASVGGKVYRIGDSIVPGYTIRTIDAANQRIEVVGPEGQARWLAREQ
jgi:hypothetical protein